MKGINTNPSGEASYTAQGEASRPPSLVVSLSGQFQGPRMLPVAPPPFAIRQLSSAGLRSSRGWEAWQEDGHPLTGSIGGTRAASL